MATATETKLPEVKADAVAEKAYAAAAEKIEAVKTVVAPVAAAAPALTKAPKIKKAPTVKQVAVKKVAPKKIVTKKIIKVKAPAKAAAKKASSVIKFPAAFQMPTISKIKDKFMATTKTQTEDFTARIKDSVADAQERAKVAYDKSTVVFGDVTEFSKGNVEALVESTKILAAGLQDMGKAYVAEGKTAIETMTADVKELAAVKSPADFIKLQGEIMRRNFDAAVATGSKNSETLVKLAGDAFAPLSTRVSMAIEKVKQAA
jgi:phasin family protein